tara:strand:+ start:34 stop:975 length:942 start_codon:yes stop_codon:yes gene_type:complete
MKSSDITLSLFIVALFIVLFMVNILSVGIKNIEDNWPTYRCNPVVMPFAGIFGQDTVTNFTYCIQTMQSNYMDFLLQPIHYNLDIVGNIGSVITDALNAARAFINNLRNFITSIVENIFGVFLNILIEFQRMLVEIKDIMGKTSGAMGALMYTMDGSVMTLKSIWNGPPGQMVRSLSGFCFGPDTKIKLKDGSLVCMKDLPLDVELKNGAIVRSVMKLSNTNENGNMKEPVYEYLGENGEKCYVTGSHLFYCEKQERFVHVQDIANESNDIFIKSDKEFLELACLITHNHTIHIGDYLFHDWEDNNGSLAKDV